MLPILPIAAAGLLLALLGSRRQDSAANSPPPQSNGQPNRTGDVPGRDQPPVPPKVAEVAAAATKAAEIIQAADRPGPTATAADNLLLACQELELHLQANRPGTERPAMVGAVQTLGGLKSDGKYGPATALLMARVLRRTPPAPRYGTAAKIAQYKADLAKLLGTSGGAGVTPPTDPRGQMTRATSEWRYGDPLPSEGPNPAPNYSTPIEPPPSATPAAPRFAPGSHPSLIG